MKWHKVLLIQDLALLIQILAPLIQILEALLIQELNQKVQMKRAETIKKMIIKKYLKTQSMTSSKRQSRRQNMIDPKAQKDPKALKAPKARKISQKILKRKLKVNILQKRSLKRKRIMENLRRGILVTKRTIIISRIKLDQAIRKIAMTNSKQP